MQLTELTQLLKQFRTDKEFYKQESFLYIETEPPVYWK